MLSNVRIRSRAWLGMIALLLLASASSGCSITQALKQPDKRDLTVFMPGRARAEVIAEVGNPSYQEVVNGRQRDVFAFRQGYTRPVKVARAIGHGFADFATVGLWEFAGYPIELALNGEEIRVMVDYDPQFIIEEVTYLRGGHLRANGPTLPEQAYGPKFIGQRAVVRLYRDETGQVVTTFDRSPSADRKDETHIAAAKPSPSAPPDVNEATYYSSSDRDGTIRASAEGPTKLR